MSTDAAPAIEVVSNDHEHRYEIFRDGVLAGFTEYRVRGNRVVFIHTEIDDAFAGQGLAGELAARALGAVAATGATIVPVCPFIASWLRRHPEFEGRVSWEDAERWIAGDHVLGDGSGSGAV